MEYFRKYLGAQPGAQMPSGTETVERLCDRVRSSTLLDDRRDAVRALRSLSKKFRLEVGSIGLDVLVDVLQNDRNDSEIVGYALECLCNVMCNELLEEEEELSRHLPADLGIQFTEVYIKSPENVRLLLSLLEEYDFHVRWPTVKLITTLLRNKGKLIQDIILMNPMGISKLMDLLDDSREIIRNDALLLLIQLAKSSTNIQKIVAFENAFERLLDIITQEGGSDGGIVVEDCLLLLLTLLKNNTSNQNFFKEGSFIPRLSPYFELDSSDLTNSPDAGWSAQKVTNIHLLLQVVRSLISPSNPQQHTTDSQRLMSKCGLLQKLCGVLMASGVPADVLTETINTVSEMIRANAANQEYFASVTAPSDPPRPALVVLLLSMVNEKQPFSLRCAVLYCFQSFLSRNELGQSQIIQTLLPSTAEVNTVSAGQLLCGGLFSADSLSTWFAAVALLHSIDGTSTAHKEQLLRVQLATSLGNPPVSLLQQATNILAQAAKVQMRVGLLMLLSHWLAYCPIAVMHFLHNSANVPFLISQVSASEGDELEQVVQGMCAFLLGLCVLYNDDQVENCHRSWLQQMIEKRIGLEVFTDRLAHVGKHESYNAASKTPQLMHSDAADVIFDYQYTRLFKKLENEILKAVSSADETADCQTQKKQVEQHESIVSQYKELIREQDTQLNCVRAELSQLKAEHAETSKRAGEAAQQIQQLRDQNALLKAQRGGTVVNTVVASDSSSEYSRLEEDILVKKREVEQKNAEIEKLKSLLTAPSPLSNGTDPTIDTTATASPDDHSLQATVDRLTADMDEMRRRAERADEEASLYRGRYEETSREIEILREQVNAPISSTTTTASDAATTVVLSERNALSSRVTELESHLRTLRAAETNWVTERTRLEGRVTELDASVTECDARATLAQGQLKDITSRLAIAEDSLTESKREQEDLLVLLAEQDNKLAAYKSRLVAHGEQISDDDEDDSECDE